MPYSLDNALAGAAASVLVTIALLLFVAQAIKWASKPGRPPFSFGDIFYDGKRHASLTRLQFFSWTIVIFFATLWIYSLRINGGLFSPAQSFPANTLALMGINTGSAIAGVAISKTKDKSDPALPDRENFWRIFYEDGKPSLARIQFFFWTYASILLFLTILFTTVIGPFMTNTAPTPIQSLTLPDIDGALVTLMGFSHVAYLGRKYNSGSTSK